jgi:hypothetical protein
VGCVREVCVMRRAEGMRSIVRDHTFGWVSMHCQASARTSISRGEKVTDLSDMLMMGWWL